MKAIRIVVLALVAGCGGGSGPSSALLDASAETGTDVDAAEASAPGADSSVADSGGLHDAGATDASSGDAAHPSDAGDGGAPPGALDYMVGIKTNGVADGPAKVQAWLGRPLDVAGTTITTTAYIGAGQSYADANGAYPLLEVSFPLLSIFGESNKLTDLAQAASGAYDSAYQSMADALAASKNPLLSVRIGWEFNGNWYAWSNGVGTNATYANYVAAFRRAAAIVKAKNPHVLVQWCVAWGQPDPTPYWPGAYDATQNPGGVDVISMDFYQANISQYNNGGQTSTWAMAQSTTSVDLDWMVTYAQSKGVKIALSEYGAGQPSSGGIGSGAGLDDGTWTAASIAWIEGLPKGLFLWTLWSDDAPADDIVTAGANPKEQAAWRSAWAGTRFGGTWWKGTPPP